MKRDALRIACCLACLLALECWGQSKPKEPPIYKSKPEDFRILDGKLYNVKQSPEWEDLPKLSSFRLVVSKVTPSGVVAEARSSYFYGAKCLVKNHPEQKKLKTGKHIGVLRVFPRGVMQFEGETIGVFDYGLPNTPENRKTLTNGVATPKP